ncbi:MAG: hypothetical protein MUE41_06645 [Gemmatimonadaceae bacterium]|jgi:hypothetical protein|nr:hypothetical protein [Gemmatimonadaceae bacterium]
MACRRTRVRRTVTTWLVAGVVGARALLAQAPSIDIRPPSSGEARDGPVITFTNLLDTTSVADLLRNGFPVRLHGRAELWSLGRWFNDLDDQLEWDVVVRYDQITRLYAVTRLADGRATPLGEFSRLVDAELATSTPFRPPLRAPRRGRRSYYAVRVDVEALSLSDLDEVQRWLRGEVAPAGRSPGGSGSGFGRGMRAMVTRVLGGDVRRYEARSPALRY